MIVSKCPRCAEAFRVPTVGLPEDAFAECPWCRETFPIAEVMHRLPPILRVMSADGESLPLSEPTASAAGFVSSSGITVDEQASVQPTDLQAGTGGREFYEGEISTGADSDFDDLGHKTVAEDTVAETINEFAPAGDDQSTADFDVEPAQDTWDDPLDANRSGAAAPMRVVATPVARRKSSSSPLRTAIGIVLGGLAAGPLAIIILWVLTLFGVNVDLGFWPLDGSGAVVSESTFAATPAPLSDDRPDPPELPPDRPSLDRDDDFDFSQDDSSTEETADDFTEPAELALAAEESTAGEPAPSQSADNDEELGEFDSTADALDSERSGQPDGQPDKTSSSLSSTGLPDASGLEDGLPEASQINTPRSGTSSDDSTPPDSELSQDASRADDDGESGPADPFAADPFAAEPSTADPFAADPFAIQEAADAGIEMPDLSEPETNEPDPVKATVEANRSDSEVAAEDQPEADVTQSVPNPEDPKSESPKPESPKPESPKPESPKPESPKPESSTPGNTEPEQIASDPSADSPALEQAVRAAAARLDELAASDRSGANTTTKQKAQAYVAIAAVGAVAERSTPSISKLINRVRQSADLPTWTVAVPDWLNYEKKFPDRERPNEGVLLIGKPDRDGSSVTVADGLAVSLTDDSTSLPNAPRVIGIGRIVTADDGPTVRLIAAEPM